MIRKRYLILPLLITAYYGGGGGRAQAQDTQTALNEISETAASICTTPPLKQSSGSLELSGDAKAKLAGLLGKFADLGLEGAAAYKQAQSEGVLQSDLAQAIRNGNDCKLAVFNALVDRLLPHSVPPKVPPQRVSGWIVTFGAKEQGGGAFRQFPSRTCTVKTPGAIDVRDLLPTGLSSRNVFIPMTATTDHQVTEAGRWVYYVKIIGAPSSYTQCMTFEIQSDGVPVGGGKLPILTGTSSTADTSAPIDQAVGMHTLTIKLACYFQGGQFPVVSLMLKPPSGQWRVPTSGDVTVEKPVQPDKPPSVSSDDACVD